MSYSSQLYHLYLASGTYNFSKLYCPNLYEKILPAILPLSQGNYEIQRRSSLWECFITVICSCDHTEMKSHLCMVTWAVTPLSQSSAIKLYTAPLQSILKKPRTQSRCQFLIKYKFNNLTHLKNNLAINS